MRSHGSTYGAPTASADFDSTKGRWPANLILSDEPEVLAGFPQAPGQQGKTGKRTQGVVYNAVDEGEAGTEPRGDTGSAARFFQQCKGGYNEAWQDLNLPPESASTAEQSSFQQRQAAVSALVLAVNSALPEGLHCSGLYLEPSTTATGGELRLIADSVTQTIQTIGPRFWLGSRPARLSLSLNHASVVANLEQTGTMTITASRWKSDGFAEDVTFNITPTNSEAGERGCEQSTDGKRFIYCAKASKRDRDEGLDDMPDRILAVSNQAQAELARGVMHKGESGTNTAKVRKNNHPTVKPTELMAYLCRLVTPPGGVVLDPFMGSGSTGKAAVREGFHFVGIEREAEYLRIAQARISMQIAATSAQQTPPLQSDLFSEILRA